MSKVIEYYNNFFNENRRLGDGCDNRHLTEKIVKQQIIKKYIKKGDKVLEVGAGTGIHSIFMAQCGCIVSACDIVPNHVELIKENAVKFNVQIDATVQDALALNYEDDKFDVVLLAGPIYHFHSLEDKMQAIKEAKRVCKKGGVVIIDFLPRLHSFIQQILRFPEFIKNLDYDDIKNLNCKDKIFSFDNKNELCDLVVECGLEILNVISTDSITRFISDRINDLSKEELDNWIELVLKINEYNVVDLGEHALIISNNG